MEAGVDFPRISIVMPVFNTGKYLIEAVNSALHQQPIADCELPSFELIVVDDHSTDAQTINILNAISISDERILVCKNLRKKGASGARNTGIMKARGHWIAFLDSDDIWFPTSLALRWRVILQNDNVRWVGAQFRFLRPLSTAGGTPEFETADRLLTGLVQDANAPEVVCLPRPVKEFGDNCMIAITTALIQRAVVVENGMFNELLNRAEDYHLWFKCAFRQNLWMVKADVTFYRIHPDSLTHGNNPKYLYEDTMVELLMADPVGRSYKAILTKRLDLVMQDKCYFYRGQRLFSAALKTALQWIAKRPLRLSAWKELVACGLRVR